MVQSADFPESEPHLAQHTTGRRSAIDARTTRHPGYAISQQKRKLVEQGFGWMKTVRGLRKTAPPRRGTGELGLYLHRGGLPHRCDCAACCRPLRDANHDGARTGSAIRCDRRATLLDEDHVTVKVTISAACWLVIVDRPLRGRNDTRIAQT